MAKQKFPFEEYTRVSWVPTIATLQFPSVAELGGGTDITCDLTKDGLNPGGSTNGVDSAALCSRVDSQVAGSVSYQFTLRCFRYFDEDDAWDLFAWGEPGYLVVRRGPLYSVAWAFAQTVEVYKAQCGEKIPASSAANTLQTFEVSMFIEDAELDGVVGGS